VFVSAARSAPANVDRIGWDKYSFGCGFGALKEEPINSLAMPQTPPASPVAILSGKRMKSTVIGWDFHVKFSWLSIVCPLNTLASMFSRASAIASPNNSLSVFPIISTSAISSSSRAAGLTSMYRRSLSLMKMKSCAASNRILKRLSLSESSVPKRSKAFSISNFWVLMTSNALARLSSTRFRSVMSTCVPVMRIGFPS